MEVNVMNPLHPSWGEFVSRMKKHEDFALCEADHAYTEKVLRTFPNVDVRESLAYLSGQGATCDCRFFTEFLGIHPEDPNFKWVTCEERNINGILFCAVEDAFNWLGDRGYSKEYIKNLVTDRVSTEVESFSK